MDNPINGKENAPQEPRTFFWPKWLLAVVCATGVGCVAYGMSFNNNVVFVLGLALVVAGYLVIRKRLKESLRGH